MKKIIIYCLIVGVASVIADPIKANIGGRNTILYGDSLSYNNPYITDGLVAFWDAEWNIGFEQHDSETTVWFDLSGNGNHLTVNNETCTFSDNSAYIQPNSIGAIGNTSLVSSDGHTTVTCIYNDTRYYVYSNFAYVYAGPWYMLCKRTNNISSSLSDYIDSIRVGTYLIGYDGSSSITIPTSVSIIRKGNGEGEIYIGDISIQTSSSSAGNAYTPRYPMFIQSGTYGTTFYSIRIYNRDLSQEEISYNYQIDKERFGLR